jgi:hypothetical protein
MLEQKRFCGRGAYTARAEQLREGHEEVDEEDEEFAHLANSTITASPCKAARRGRIASRYEFASHRYPESCGSIWIGLLSLVDWAAEFSTPPP